MLSAAMVAGAISGGLVFLIVLIVLAVVGVAAILNRGRGRGV